MKANEIQTVITNKIIENLKKVGAYDYQCPWMPSELPFNPCTKSVYTGVNQLILSLVTMDQGFKTNRWVTFKNAQKLGGTIVKGSKSTEVIYYTTMYKYQGNWITLSEVKKLCKSLKCPAEELNLTKRSFMKYYRVFNIDQVEGLKEELYAAAYREEIYSNPTAEDVINGTGAKIYNAYQDRAYYTPSTDEIRMPLQRQFNEDDHYYKTLFHELGHWTGHKSRLDRDLSGSFGDKKYAFEELIAELSAAFSCQKVGIESTLLTSSEYIKNWLTALQNDESFVFKASAAATKASNYVFEGVAYVRPTKVA